KGSMGNEEKTRRQRIIEKLETAYRTANEQKQWITIRLAQFDNFSLCVVIAPPTEGRSATPILAIQSPKLTNRLIIKDQDAFNDLAALIEAVKKDTELLSTVFSWLDSKNPRVRRKTAIIEL
ncbi:MAG: hypothetical protein QXK88_10685, partial [Desulfurococcaceae archaeon]